MADTVTSATLENAQRNLVMKFTNVSDGTGELDVIKVNATTLSLTTSLKIRRLLYNVTGGAVRIQWHSGDAPASNTDSAYLSGYGEIDLRDTEGMPYQAGFATGPSIAFTTSGFQAAGVNIPASGYTVILEMIKGQ